MGFIQRAFAERPGIQTSAGDVEVGVERAIRLHLNRQTDALEPVNHNAATGQQFLTTSFAFRQAFRREAGERRMLRGRVGAQVVVGGQIVNRFQHSGLVRQNRPAEAPAGHAEELGEAVAYDGIGVAGQYGLDFGTVRLPVSQIKVGFVHDAPCAAAGGQLAHLVQYVEVDGGAGGVGRRRDHYGLGLARPVLAAQVGGIGIAPGANIGDECALFEATHGTAPKYAGQDKVNPGSIILSAEMMLRHMGWTEAADLIVKGMEGAINAKTVTYDFERLMEGAKLLKCSEFGDAIIKNM